MHKHLDLPAERPHFLHRYLGSRSNSLYAFRSSFKTPLLTNEHNFFDAMIILLQRSNQPTQAHWRAAPEKMYATDGSVFGRSAAEVYSGFFKGRN